MTYTLRTWDAIVNRLDHEERIDIQPHVEPTCGRQNKEKYTHDCLSKSCVNIDSCHVGSHVTRVMQEQDHHSYRQLIAEKRKHDQSLSYEVMQKELVHFSVCFPADCKTFNDLECIDSQLYHVVGLYYEGVSI